MEKEHYNLGVGLGSIADGPTHVFRVTVGEPFAEPIPGAGGEVYAIGRLGLTPAGDLALAIAFTALVGGASPLAADTVLDADHPRVRLESGGRPIRWALLAGDDSSRPPDALVWLLDNP